MKSIFVYIAAAWSGFFIMCLELLGGRLLAPFFGTGVFVWGSIISVFMLSLSIGYLLGGKLSSVQTPTLRGLGILILAEATLAFPVVTFGDSALEALSYVIQDPRYGSMAGAVILFGMSSVASGMISPYAVRLLVVEVKDTGSLAGKLYFFSTMGSALGTLITSFYLVLILDINLIIYYAMFVSCIVGIALLVAYSVSRECNELRSVVKA